MNNRPGSGRELRQLLSGAYCSQTVRGIDFSGAALVSVATPRLLFIQRCQFTEADLRQATLDGCCFKFCNFERADLRGASLRGASFSGCDLSGADFRGADLYDASFSAVGAGAGARPTTLDGARFDPGALRESRFGAGIEAPG